MKRNYCVLFLSVLFLVCSCSRSFRAADFEAAMENVAESGETVAMGDMTSFEWDTV